MIPILYEHDETEFRTNGIGRLPDCVSCEVTEERNGVFEMELVYPVTGLHFKDIALGRIVYTTHDASKAPQPFDIYGKSVPIDGNVTFYAHHISYRLNEIVVRPFTVQGTAGTALNALKANAVNSCPFTFDSDRVTSLEYSLAAPDTLRHILGGVEGSILDVYGGADYTFDKFHVSLSNRGADHGVNIRYGKNLTDIDAETDAEGTFTGVVPYWKNETELVTLPEWYITAQGAGNEIRLAPMDLSDEWQEAPTAAELRAKAQERLDNSGAWEPVENIEVEFAPLWQTTEYEDVEALQRVLLCDTVEVFFNAAGVSAKMRVIKTVYNSLTEKYVSVELGTPRTTLAESIEGRTTEKILKQTVSKGYMSEAIDHATDMITGGLGGHVVIGKNANGRPEEILIMDTDNVQTAVNVIRMNRNGIGFSSNGYQGPYVSAWTIDGTFNTNYINVNSLSVLSQNAGTITAGILQSSDYAYTSGNYSAAGMIIDLNNKVIRTPKTAILANGSIYSTSVYLTGDLTTTGTISGYTAKTYINGGYIKFYINDAEAGRIWPYAWGDDYVNAQGIALLTSAKYLAIGHSALADIIINNGLNPDGYTEGIQIRTALRTIRSIVSTDSIYASGSVRACSDTSSADVNLWVANSLHMYMDAQHVGYIRFRSSVVTTTKDIIRIAEDGSVTYAGGTFDGGIILSNGSIELRNGSVINGNSYTGNVRMVSISDGILTNGAARLTGYGNRLGAATYVDGQVMALSSVAASKAGNTDNSICLSYDGTNEKGELIFRSNASGSSVNKAVISVASDGAVTYAGGTFNSGIALSSGAITLRNGSVIDGVSYSGGAKKVSISDGIQTNGTASMSGYGNRLGAATYVDGQIMALSSVTASKAGGNANAIWITYDGTNEKGELIFRSNASGSSVTRTIMSAASDGTITYLGGTFSTSIKIGTNKTAYNDGLDGAYIGTDGTIHLTSVLLPGISNVPGLYFHYDGATAATSSVKGKQLSGGGYTVEIGPSASIAGALYVSGETTVYSAVSAYEEGHAISLGKSSQRWYQVWSTSFNMATGVYINYNSSNDYIYASKTIHQASDEKLKDIEDFDERYSSLLDQLKPIMYTWKNSSSNVKHVGLGARGTKKALDDIGLGNSGFVGSDTNENGEVIYSVDYAELSVMLLYAVQQLRKQISRRRSTKA